MIHHPKAIESSALCLLRNGAKLIAKMSGAAGVREIRNLQTNSHALSPRTKGAIRPGAQFSIT
jgi:hypothetical protein